MTIEDLRHRSIVVNVRSEEEARDFVGYVLESGLAKNGWSLDNTRYNVDGMYTCYEIELCGDMYHASKSYYFEHDYEIVTMDDIDCFSGEEIPLSSDNIEDLLM